jgi:hypothetical protein
LQLPVLVHTLGKEYKNISGFATATIKGGKMGKQRGYVKGAGTLTKVALAVGAMFPLGGVMAQTAGTAAPVATQASTPATTSGDSQVDTVTINGVKKGELILPTSVKSSSAFGIDLGVMDTPRSNTILSRVQLEALNVQDPSEFSYLTSGALPVCYVSLSFFAAEAIYSFPRRSQRCH